MAELLVIQETLYYGESRSGSLLETDPNFREGVAKRLGLTDGELNPDRQPFTDFQQIEHYQNHLVHILAETCSYGFKLAVFVVGHYPLVDHARAANLLYKQWVYDKPWGKMDVWAFADFQLLGDLYNNPGDHGGKWETSHLLASHPDTVDLNLATKELQYGILTTQDPINSTAAFGEEIYDAIAKRVAILVNRRMIEPEKYNGHGSPVDAAWTDF
ncbi:MAG: creatininase family protein [Christensenellales bacterium]